MSNEIKVGDILYTPEWNRTYLVLHVPTPSWREHWANRYKIGVFCFFHGMQDEQYFRLSALDNRMFA